MEERNKVLRAATQEVCDKVTDDNELQSPLDAIRSKRDIVFCAMSTRLAMPIFSMWCTSDCQRRDPEAAEKQERGYASELAVLGY